MQPGTPWSIQFDDGLNERWEEVAARHGLKTFIDTSMRSGCNMDVPVGSSLQRHGHATIIVSESLRGKPVEQWMLAHEIAHFHLWLDAGYLIAADRTPTQPVRYAISTLQSLVQDLAVYPMVSGWSYQALPAMYFDRFQVFKDRCAIRYLSSASLCPPSAVEVIRAAELAHANMVATLAARIGVRSADRAKIVKTIRFLVGRTGAAPKHYDAVKGLFGDNDPLTANGATTIIDSLFKLAGLQSDAELLDWRQYVDRHGWEDMLTHPKPKPSPPATPAR